MRVEILSHLRRTALPWTPFPRTLPPLDRTKCRFFPLSHSMFPLFFLSWGGGGGGGVFSMSYGYGSRPESAKPGGLQAGGVTQNDPGGSPNAQLGWSMATTRGHNSTRRPPKRDTKRANIGRERGKKREMLGSPPFAAPLPHHHHPSGPHSSGPTASLPPLPAINIFLGGREGRPPLFLSAPDAS